jgi:hypothetical protein
VEGAKAGLATRGESFGWQAIRPELSIGVHGGPWTSGSTSRKPQQFTTFSPVGAAASCQRRPPVNAGGTSGGTRRIGGIDALGYRQPAGTASPATAPLASKAPLPTRTRPRGEFLRPVRHARAPQAPVTRVARSSLTYQSQPGGAGRAGPVGSARARGPVSALRLSAHAHLRSAQWPRHQYRPCAPTLAPRGPAGANAAGRAAAWRWCMTHPGLVGV